LGTIPETLSRVIKKFKDKGLIEMNGNVITLKDQETLKEIAQGLRRI
jgi:CRP/FNR family transcriptional regulator